MHLFLETLVNSPSLSPLCDSHSPALLDLFISSDAIICSTVVFLCWEVLYHVVSVCIDFQIQKGMLFCTTQVIFMLIMTVFTII